MRTRCKTRVKEQCDSSIHRLHKFNKTETNKSHWWASCTNHSQLKRNTVCWWTSGWPWLKGLMISWDHFCGESFIPQGENVSVTGPAILCHFNFFCVKVNYVYVDEIYDSLHFCSHTDGFHSNLPRVWKEAHSLQEGEGRKVMGLVNMKMDATLAGISACLF